MAHLVSRCIFKTTSLAVKIVTGKASSLSIVSGKTGAQPKFKSPDTSQLKITGKCANAKMRCLPTTQLTPIKLFNITCCRQSKLTGLSLMTSWAVGMLSLKSCQPPNCRHQTRKRCLNSHWGSLLMVRKNGKQNSRSKRVAPTLNRNI